MKIGTCIEGYGRGTDFKTLIGNIVRAEQDGFETLWFGGINEPLISCAVAARETENIEMMSAIVVSYPKHPYALAQEAVTTQAALEGRFVLGIGPASRPLVERLGYSYDRSAANMREYVQIVRRLVRGEKVNLKGDFYTAEELIIAQGWVQPMPVLMSALGPQMLRACGEVADGTVTWMVGLNTLRDFVAPRLTRAAAKAGREAPRIAVGLPVAVCDDVEAGKAAAASAFQNYGRSPHYNRMIQMEGKGIEDVVVCGSEEEVSAKLHAFAAAGATHFYAYPYAVGDGDGEASLQRTRELVTSLVSKV